MPLVNLQNAVNKLYLAKSEFGYNKAKETLISEALTSLGTALTGDTNLTGAVAIAAVKEAQKNAKFAIEAGQGRGTGSGFVTTDQKILSETLHTAAAFDKANEALKTPSV